MLKEIKVESIIVPNKVIYNGKLYKIVDIDEKFIVTEYMVSLFEGKIFSVKINCSHPNADPTSGEVCIPANLQNHGFSEKSKAMIHSILCCFNLDNCYFTPWGEFQYEKMEV
jgi:hypothetical protein